MSISRSRVPDPATWEGKAIGSLAALALSLRSSELVVDGDWFLGCFAHVSEAITFASDKANLLDLSETGKVGRLVHHIVDESAAVG